MASKAHVMLPSNQSGETAGSCGQHQREDRTQSACTVGKLLRIFLNNFIACIEGWFTMKYTVPVNEQVVWKNRSDGSSRGEYRANGSRSVVNQADKTKYE